MLIVESQCLINILNARMQYILQNVIALWSYTDHILIIRWLRYNCIIVIRWQYSDCAHTMYFAHYYNVFIVLFPDRCIIPIAWWQSLDSIKII